VRRPNILLLYTDQQRADALGANGNGDVQTPNLDALAAEGVNFERFFVQNPVCMPSRMSMLTGLYPSRLRITRNGTPLGRDEMTLPRILRNFGYRTANIGKLHFLPHANRDHRQVHPSYGFDHLEVSDEPGDYEDAYRAWVARTAPDQLRHIGVGPAPAARAWQETMGTPGPTFDRKRDENRPRPFAGRSDVTHTAFVAERTIEFLQAHRDRPFFCIAGFYSPHSPWVAPREFFDLYDPATLKLPAFPPELQAERQAKGFDDETLRAARRGYYAMVSEVDHHAGRILACLAGLGLAEQTIVIFTSDHGEWLGEHLRYGKGYPAHDAITRVPLILRYPGGGACGGKTVSHFAEAVDVAPTLLDLAGLPVPPHLQGRRLPLPGADLEPRRSALTEGDGWKTLRTADFRYVLEGDGREMLYDLRGPLGEYADLAADAAHAAVLAEHRKQLARRLIENERMLPRAWPY
jgi:arylsulfatase A-like enzyme